MANITVKSLVDMVAGFLQDQAADETDRHWPESELLSYYNVAAMKIVAASPEANTVTQAVKLASGSKQSIPAAGQAILDVIRNMGVDGLADGEAVTRADLEIIRAFDRNWSVATPDDVILNFMPDPHDPRTFYTYPPADGSSYVLVKFSETPTQIVWDEEGSWESAMVGVSDQYVSALIEEIVKLAYRKDSDFPGNMEREAKSGNDALQSISIAAQR